MAFKKKKKNTISNNIFNMPTSIQWLWMVWEEIVIMITNLIY